MIIVSNTGPLIGLAKIQQLGLLGRLAAEVYIPPQVRLELLARSGPETALIVAALKDSIQLAKRQGLITAVAPLLGDLRGLGYWISDEVVAVVKNLAGESMAG